MFGFLFLASQGSDIDDPAVIVLDHRGQHGPAAVEYAAEIDVDDALPVGIGLLPRGQGLARDARAANQHVDAARRASTESTVAWTDAGSVTSSPQRTRPAARRGVARPDQRRLRHSGPRRRPWRPPVRVGQRCPAPMPRAAPVTRAVCPLRSKKLCAIGIGRFGAVGFDRLRDLRIGRFGSVFVGRRGGLRCRLLSLRARLVSVHSRSRFGFRRAIFARGLCGLSSLTGLRGFGPAARTRTQLTPAPCASGVRLRAPRRGPRP